MCSSMERVPEMQQTTSAFFLSGAELAHASLSCGAKRCTKSRFDCSRGCFITTQDFKSWEELGRAEKKSAPLLVPDNASNFIKKAAH